jgi:hypothetical protein
MKKFAIIILLASVSISPGAWENQDWLVDYDWYISDGRDTVNPLAGHIYWHEHMIPFGVFKKFDVPANSILYKERLRNERFDCFYQIEKQERIFFIGTGTGNDFFDLRFENNYSAINPIKDGRIPFGRSNRTGGRRDPEHPLVGIWGELPALLEYRLVKPDSYVYSLAIDKEIPGWAVRHGTYLFKQVGDKIFETDTSFPDGHLRLEILSQETLLITPLFTVPTEEGRIDPLALKRIPKRSASR